MITQSGPGGHDVLFNLKIQGDPRNQAEADRAKQQFAGAPREIETVATQIQRRMTDREGLDSLR